MISQLNKEYNDVLKISVKIETTYITNLYNNMTTILKLLIKSNTISNANLQINFYENPYQIRIF